MNDVTKALDADAHLQKYNNTDTREDFIYIYLL